MAHRCPGVDFWALTPKRLSMLWDWLPDVMSEEHGQINHRARALRGRKENERMQWRQTVSKF